MTIDLLAACHKRGPRFLVVCERERKNIPTYIYLRSKAFEYVERGEGKRVNVFLTYREWHVALWLPYQYFFFQLQLSAPFSDVRINFPSSDGRNVTPVFVARIRYDTCLPLYLPFFFLSLFLSSSISLDELPIAIARLPPTNLVFIHIFTSFTGSRSSTFRSIAVSTAMR